MNRDALRIGFACGVLVIVLLTALSDVMAQATESCGVVDAIDDPVDLTSTLERGFNDFARFRQRWGGIHVGIDLAFDREGDVVRAAARGRVMVSNTAEWDTELGVVVLQHIMPDSSIMYSLYGHVIESETLRFPPVGACVGRGDRIGVIGDPSLSRPHLHYEWRSILPYEGGPGYVASNPIALGWQHPLDYTAYWRARLTGAVRGSLRFDSPPTLPPALLANGGVALVSADQVQIIDPNGALAYRVTATDTITAVVPLSGERIAVLARDGALDVIQSGRYLARWQTPVNPRSLYALGDALIVAARDGALRAFDAAGTPLWTFDSPGAGAFTVSADVNGALFGLGVRRAGVVTWRMIDANGATVHQTQLSAPNPIITTAPDGAWLMLDGAQIRRMTNGVLSTLATVTPAPGRGARIAAGADGSALVFLADADAALILFDADGSQRWRVRYPARLAGDPLMAVGECGTYTLDSDGVLNLFRADDGELAAQMPLYAGGDVGSADARLLQAFAGDQIVFGAGFLTAVLIDGRTLIGNCP